ncbi:hypothetical protein FCM35_KLT11227 [Carex littledalei]|uniref:Uncharacterized protein n=1 Tax=Carex littledalei TaxID=544730 RepID=A0A833QHR3_9POAL|nr:hypothetical protein FCM35_KLT11227 [Carex littledalei]
MAIGLSDSQPICRICLDMPVSAVELQKPLMAARDINRAPNEACTSLFMDDIFLAPVERMNEFFNELCRDYMERTMQLNNLRKKIQIQKRKVCHQKLEDLGRYLHLTSTVRKTTQTLMHMSFINKRHRRRVKLPLSRNCRQIMEDSQDNLCQAVQEMQLNSESSVKKSECMQSGDKFLAKVDNPSEIAEDLSKLCMKD